MDRTTVCILAGLFALLCLTGWFLFKDDQRHKMADQMHRTYCESRGYHVYNAWGRKCVDNEGHERLIPDDYWAPLG